MAFLEGHEITRQFGGLTALSKVSFTVEPGEFVGLIGANGAGKTTLFNVISGALRPSSGRVIFQGQDITGRKPYVLCRLGLARTFQLVRPFLAMTVADNVAMGALFGYPRKSKGAAINDALEILELVRLKEKAYSLASTLTLAERKRLELARCLATRPSLLLLDEVLAGLNPTETEASMELIREIHSRLGITIMMIEHVIRALVGLSQRIIVLHYGEVIAQGSPQQVANNPLVIEAYLGPSAP